MLRIDIITVLPELLESPLNHSIIKRAKQKNLGEIHIHNLRNWSTDKHKNVDAYSFGDGSKIKLFAVTVLTHYDDTYCQGLYGCDIKTAVRRLARSCHRG